MEAELKQGRKGYGKEHAAKTVETYALGHHTYSERRVEVAIRELKEIPTATATATVTATATATATATGTSQNYSYARVL